MAAAPKPLVVLGLLGSTLDRGLAAKRWNRWRPTVGTCWQPDLPVARLELLVQPSYERLGKRVAEDIAGLEHADGRAPTEVRQHPFELPDPWDFEDVYSRLLDFARAYPFDTEAEDYLVHITTGSHVAQICLFLLAEARFLPARLLQTSPDRGVGPPGQIRVIDLDLSRYDAIARRFAEAQAGRAAALKGGIATRSAAYNRMIDEIERVAIASRDPMLLLGPTGAGKTHLARRIYRLKRAEGRVRGRLVEVNCATIRGDGAMSALFGHTRGAFTGAVGSRPGLLKTADGGVLFLDEIGELALDEQAMLLRALESGRFLPVGADVEAESRFQLIAGTNRPLGEAVRQGRFRADLLARIDTWSWSLPGLAERREDIEPNVDFELERFARDEGRRVAFNREARRAYLDFAQHPGSSWDRNFRDLGASIRRMATLAPGGRIGEAEVRAELARLRRAWGAGSEQGAREGSDEALLTELLGEEGLAGIDPFDRVQLAYVVRTCRRSRSMAEAGRSLFAVSRTKRASTNDSDRVRKYLARHGLSWADLGAAT